MAGAPDKPADPEWIHTLKHGGCFPYSESHLCSHAWASPPGHNFFVRGPHYPEITTKVPAAEPLLQPIGFDLIISSSRISNFMDHPQCRVRAALDAAREAAAEVDGAMDRAGEKPFVWAFNLQLPSKDNLSLVMYFVSFHSPEKGSLLQRFLDEDDTFRNDRIKMITAIPQGPRIVKLMKKERGPGCLIGKVSNCSYQREKEYMEIDVDLGSSMIARAAFQLCCGFAPLVTVEFAFVIEGRCNEELPEKVVGAMRLANLDLSLAMSMDNPLPRGQVESASKSKRRTSYRGIWKTPSTAIPQLPVKGGDVDKEEKKLSDGLSKAISLP